MLSSFGNESKTIGMVVRNHETVQSCPIEDGASLLSMIIVEHLRVLTLIERKENDSGM